MTSNNYYHLAMQRVFKACIQHGQKREDVRVLAVSKGQDIVAMQRLYEQGQREFAENYLQEALSKQSLWNAPDMIWHFIGPIQTNKCKKIAEHFDWVHSVSRIKELKLLDQHRPAEQKPLQICIQVNLAHEAQKSGVGINDLDLIIEQCSTLSRVKLRGLMLIPPAHLSDMQLFDLFNQLTLLKQEINQRAGLQLDMLSMGMSDDFELAIRAGSTCLRLGRILFGGRNG